MKSLVLILSIFVSAYLLASTKVEAPKDVRNLKGITLDKKDLERYDLEDDVIYMDTESRLYRPIKVGPKETEEKID